jgi:hypothetical protein
VGARSAQRSNTPHHSPASPDGLREAARRTAAAAAAAGAAGVAASYDGLVLEVGRRLGRVEQRERVERAPLLMLLHQRARALLRGSSERMLQGTRGYSRVLTLRMIRRQHAIAGDDRNRCIALLRLEGRPTRTRLQDPREADARAHVLPVARAAQPLLGVGRRPLKADSRRTAHSARAPSG